MDFSETFGEVRDGRRGRTKPSSPKRSVLALHPLAYSVRYPAGAWFVYEKPAKAAPRGQMPQVVILGQGNSAPKAWKDAARHVRVAREKARSQS